MNVAGLPTLHAADIGFRDVGIHLHLGQVLRDLEQRRRLQACGHGLSDVHVARHHHAITGACDIGVIQVGLGLCERRLRPV